MINVIFKPKFIQTDFPENVCIFDSLFCVDCYPFRIQNIIRVVLIGVFNFSSRRLINRSYFIKHFNRWNYYYFVHSVTYRIALQSNLIFLTKPAARINHSNLVIFRSLTFGRLIPKSSFGATRVSTF